MSHRGCGVDGIPVPFGSREPTSAKCAKVDESAFGKAPKQAAELVGASSRYVEMAKRILEEAPDLIPLICSDPPNDDGTPKMTIQADIWASSCRTCEML